MTRVDVVALAFVAFAALVGGRKGLIGSALSTAGIVVGAVVGARLAPHLLAGDDSPYTPLVGLAGAGIGAVVLETVGTLIGNAVRRTLRLSPLRALDSVGGVLLGALSGLVIVWVVGAVALHFPGQEDLRRGAQRSLVLQRLNGVVPPARLMAAIQRVEPFPSIAGPATPIEPPDPSLLQSSGVERAAPSVVRVLGSACGLAISGSGWVAAPGLVVTAAHVVAGQRDTRIEHWPSRGRFEARAVFFDARNDLAILRVQGLDARPLDLGEGTAGTAVAILGYPQNGPFHATAGRLGRTTTVLAEDARGRGPVRRTVTTFSGDVRQGNSGGPAVDAAGRVGATVFAARVGGPGGYGVPPRVVGEALDRVAGPVSTGPCVSP